MYSEQKNLVNKFLMSLYKGEDISVYFQEEGYIEEVNKEGKEIYSFKNLQKWVEKQQKLNCLHLSLNDCFQTSTENTCEHIGMIQVLGKNSILMIFTCKDLLINENGKWKFLQRNFELKEINKDRIEMYLGGLDKESFKKFKRIEKKPKRIFVMRTGESEAAGNRKIYANTPDNRIKLTETGKRQALEGGKKLKEIIGDESVIFYLSPFTRAKETFEYVSKAWEDKKFRFKEDSRLREQGK